MTPAEEVADAAQRLTVKAPYGLLSDPLADLLYALTEDMEDRGAVEGSASHRVHPPSPLGFGLMESRSDWTAALALARLINEGAS